MARVVDDEQIGMVVAELTVDEKCALLVGVDFAAVAGCARVGIPGWRVSDGPVGVRGRSMTVGLLLPSSSAVAATWDVALVEDLGVALGHEALDRDVDLVLGPTVNLHRSPRAGRHFEMFSEDPELSARLVVAYVRGLQSQGVGACVKHFVANDQEHERTTIDVHVDERTLREVYLRPFEAAVIEAGARSIMASYNYVNGAHACASAELLLDVLKHEWGFDGMVLSDWDAMKDTVRPARNGLDVEMPGPGRWWGGGQLAAALVSGEVDEALVDDKVRRVLAFLVWRGRLPGETTTDDERSVDRPEHRALVRRAAAAGAVLMKNDGLLPLAPGRSVALIGPGAVATALLGGGSASLTPHPSPTVAEAMTARYDGSVSVAPGIELRRVAPSVTAEWIGPDGVTVELYDGPEFAGVPFRVDRLERPLHAWFASDCPPGVRLGAVRVRLSLVPDVGGRFRIMGAASHRGRLFVDGELVTTNDDGFKVMLGLTGGAAELTLEAGRTYDVVLESTPRDSGAVNYSVVDVGIEPVAGDRDELLTAAEYAATVADVAVVVVGSSSEWESEGQDRADLVLPAGQDELVQRVLAVNPRTVVVLNCGAPMVLPWLDDVPAALLAWYPGQEGGEAVVDVLLGDAEPGGRMPTTWARAERDTPSYLHYPGEAGVVRYGEELHVGYRWYDARGIEPMLPFGHGGSYTEFVWGEPSLAVDGADVLVEVPVTNVGARRGSDVLQVYVAPLDPMVLRPPKQLAAFAKVHLDPGETAIARLVVSERAFARWDVLAHDWVVDAGPYELVVAASVVDERFRVGHEIGVHA